MNLLHEMAIRAKSDGACTLEWPTLINSIYTEGGLQDIPGESDIQKLRAWADRQSLYMDFDLESKGFTISTITFWNRRQSAGHTVAGLSVAAQDHSGSDVDHVVGGS